MFFTECLLKALNGINANLTGIRNLLRHQLEQQSKETPKEAAPAPKVITWQEAAKTLRDLCEAQRYCADCPAQAWCDSAVPINTKVITPREWEVPANEQPRA